MIKLTCGLFVRLKEMLLVSLQLPAVKLLCLRQ